MLSYDPLTIDLFASQIKDNGNLQPNDNADTDLFGINASYKLGDKMSTVIEAYTFAKNDKGNIQNVASGGFETKTRDLFVPGLRVSTNPIEGLNVQLEGAYEFGDAGLTLDRVEKPGEVKVSAYGAQGKVNYALPVLKDLKPVLSAGYTYLSGDKNGADNKGKAFNPLYENQNTGRIYDSLFSATNQSLIEAAFELAPIQDLTAKLSWYNVSKAQKASSVSPINQPNAAAGQAVVENGKKDLGNELDLDLTYAYTEDVKFGVSAGYFAPGKAFDAVNKDSATQLLSSVSVAF